MITLTFNCSGLDEAAQLLNAVQNIGVKPAAATEPEKTDEKVSKAPSKKTSKKKSSKKDSKKAKDDSNGTGDVTEDEVRKAIASSLKICGHSATLAILKKHSAEKLTELDSSKYASFVDDCNEAVANIQN